MSLTALEPHPAELRFQSAHFIGICGAGMKPIAHALLSLGIRVAGSDLEGGKEASLSAAGATIHPGHAAEHLGEADVVVYSSAIPESNPEMMAARRRGIRCLHRSEMLAWFLAQRESILIAGTHGKTTTTAMTAILLEAAGMDPWGFVGGSVPRFGGNLRAGGERFAVAEADESDGSFLLLPRDHAIITNIEAEHLNYWRTEERLFEGFETFAAAIPTGGIIALCADDPGIQRLLPALGAHGHTYSAQGAAADYSAREIHLHGEGSRFRLHRGDQALGWVELHIPGIHNVSNATGALALALELGADFERIRQALLEFRGVDRRFTKRVADAGFMVIDDYGHHPTEMAATLAAARMLANERAGRLHVVFQPHRYTRTESFLSGFGPALRGADAVVVTDVYAAGEAPIPGVSGETLARRMPAGSGCPVEYIPGFEDIRNFIHQSAKKSDIVLILGAGSVTKLSYLL